MAAVDQIWSEAVRTLERNQPFALATVINVRGSTPREVGAKMIIREDGQVGKNSVRRKGGQIEDLAGCDATVLDAGETAVDYAKAAYENRGDTIRSGQQAMAKTVQDNPLGALLVAGGIGFALALLMTRPPRRPPPRWRYYG